MGQPINTTNTPPRKKLVAFILCFWKKKRKVLSRPMTKESPATKRICRDKKKKSGNILEKGSKLQAHAIKYPVLSSASYKYHPNRLKESNYLH